jgi:hypothetical protein
MPQLLDFFRVNMDEFVWRQCGQGVLAFIVRQRSLSLLAGD